MLVPPLPQLLLNLALNSPVHSIALSAPPVSGIDPHSCSLDWQGHQEAGRLPVNALALELSLVSNIYHEP